MATVHMVLGALLIATNATVAIWGLVAFRRNRAPGGAFTQVLALAQTMVIAQATFGLVLISDGLRPGDSLHFAYGLIPLIAVAYPYALRGDDGRRNVLLFSIGSALVAALGVRAYMTGGH
jgi:multisubunit Na+/H+ antiporter MnhB subunit